MSRKRRRNAFIRSRRRTPFLQRWTIQRASSLGLLCGLGAILVAALIGTESEAVRYGYALLLAVAALCGASILWITATDMRERGTSGKLWPIRVFDLALGIALLLPAGYALNRIWPLLWT